MLPDNAAVEVVEYRDAEDEFDRLTDRELLLLLVRQQKVIVDLVQEVAPSVTPMIEKLQSNPMLKMILGK